MSFHTIAGGGVITGRWAIERCRGRRKEKVANRPEVDEGSNETARLHKKEEVITIRRKTVQDKMTDNKRWKICLRRIREPSRCGQTKCELSVVGEGCREGSRESMG